MHHIYTKAHYKRGNAIMTAVVFFLVVGMIMVTGVSAVAYRDVKIANELIQSRGSYYLAEAGMEDAVYRLKNGISISTTESLVLNGFTATTTITDVSGGKLITTEGDQSDNIRKIETRLTNGVGAAFNYGVQTGNGGFEMANGSGVVGNVYSNGDITGSGYVTGSAIAANSSSLTADQVNATPESPANSISFRNTSSAQDLAQSFQVSDTQPINKISLYIRKVGSPSAATVEIRNNSGSNPGSTVLASGTLNAAQVTGSYGWVEVVMTTDPNLIEGTVYWLVINSTTQSATNYYQVGANTTYGNGQAKIGQQGGTWNATSPSGLDAYFQVYIGGGTSLINGITVGSGGVGDAHANRVTNSTVAGALYCQTGSGNNKSCNTSRPDPTPQNMPLSDANIQQFKDDAAAGGVISGSYSPAGTSTSFGPKKITGNLTVDNGHNLTVTGTVWVTGNLSISNNAVVRLSSTYGTASGVIVVDGTVSISNGAQFYGTGQTGSYIMVLSTSDCGVGPVCATGYAIELGNNAGAVVLNAQKGALRLSNNAGTKEATAYRIILSNNATIVYESGLANQNFTNGPSGGYTISSWQEIE